MKIRAGEYLLAGISTALLLCAGTSIAQDDGKVQHLESRIIALEKRVRQMEMRFEQALNPGKSPQTQAAVEPRRTSASFAQAPLSARLMKKSLKIADVGEKEDKIALLISFRNDGAMGVASFKGEVIFKDIYADSIMSFIAEIEKIIAPNMSNSWFGGITYDARNDSHRRLLDLGIDRIKVEFKPEQIVYSNGTTKNFK